MEPGGLADLEDLTLCSCCKLPFNETDQTPKVLACRHHFCLKCISTVMLKGRELYCIHCWKRTEMPDHKPENLPTYTAVLVLTQNFGTLTINPHHIHPKPPDKPVNSHLNSKMKTISENCHTHAMPFTLWCLTCQMQTCRACATATEHCSHQIKPLAEARDVLRSDAQVELTSMHKMVVDMQHMVLKQRDFLLKILDACTTLKTKVETDLVNHIPSSELADARDSLSKAKMYLEMSENQSPVEVYRLFSDLNIEKQRLHNKYQEMYLQCKLDDLIRHSSVIFDFELLKQALSTIHNNDINLQALGITNGPGSHNPILFLANYCMSQLYSRHYISKQNQNYAVQNGNVEYPHMMSQQAVLPVMTSPVMNHKNNFTENISPKSNVFLNEGTMMTIQNIKPNLTYHENNPMLGSPNIHKNNQYHFENTAALIPSVAHSTHSNQSSIIHSSQNSLISPTSMVPAAIVMPPQQGNIVHSPQTLIRNPTTHIYPVYYFNIEINGAPFGRILIEVRNDVAPKMSKNFGILCTGELGYGYKGCNIFQCWENESIITGDFELNNGRGGRSVFEEGFFMPDDTKILAIRGSVGMRRSQKRHDNMGLVGSQFRIILREMRGFTGIFAFVVEGLELIERISQSGDSAGKPQNNVVITSCGKMN